MKTGLLKRLVSRHRVTRDEVKDQELGFCSVERCFDLPVHFAFLKALGMSTQRQKQNTETKIHAKTNMTVI